MRYYHTDWYHRKSIFESLFDVFTDEFNTVVFCFVDVHSALVKVFKLFWRDSFVHKNKTYTGYLFKSIFNSQLSFFSY